MQLFWILKYRFCKKSLRKSWSGKKSEPKVFNWSEFHFSAVTSYKIHTLEVEYPKGDRELINSIATSNWLWPQYKALEEDAGHLLFHSYSSVIAAKKNPPDMNFKLGDIHRAITRERTILCHYNLIGLAIKKFKPIIAFFY